VTPTLTRTYNAGGTIAARRIVKFGNADHTVVQGAAATDAMIGVSADLGAGSGERIDVHLSGVAEVAYGGDVTRGALLTSDSNGAAVAAAPAAGANVAVIGRAMVSGVSGDVGLVLLGPGQIQGA
jgi:hypothetical protein